MSANLRLQKFMAECGVASRRAAERLIVAGQVKVNGKVVTQLGTKVDPAKDRVIVDGKLLMQKEEKIYLKLNKPVGVVSAASDEKEQTVVDLVKDVPGRIYPVGRLDMGSEGLILLTNDGELANKLMHPRYEHEKEYEVRAQSPVSDAQLKELAQGVIIDGKKTLPAKVQRKSDREFRIILKEGRNRQLRKMLEAVGNRASRLRRTRIKNISLGILRPGKYAYLTPAEITDLLA